MNDKEKIKSFFQSQFDFQNVSEGDTIVDTGAQSGTYEGCFLSVNDLKTVSFILVDIDPTCLNQPKKFEGQIHGGCHNPLLSFQKINELFTSNGYRLSDKKDIIRKKDSDVLMVRYTKD
jgi:hypothetical protein